MCVLALWVGVDRGTPLLVGANRDEAYSRASAPPIELAGTLLAGRDLVGGGTWLGVRRDGFFVAIVNRRTPPRTDRSASRGTLVMEALQAGSIADAEGVVARRVGELAYGGFTLVVVQGRSGLSVHYDGTLRVAEFGTGRHVVASDYDLDDPRLPEAQVFTHFTREHPGIPSERALIGFLSSHAGTRPVCKHGMDFGTVSSAIVAIDDRGTVVMRAALGPPCRTEFALPVRLTAPGS